MRSVVWLELWLSYHLMSNESFPLTSFSGFSFSLKGTLCDWLWSDTEFDVVSHARMIKRFKVYQVSAEIQFLNQILVLHEAETQTRHTNASDASSFLTVSWKNCSFSNTCFLPGTLCVLPSTDASQNCLDLLQSWGQVRPHLEGTCLLRQMYEGSWVTWAL